MVISGSVAFIAAMVASLAAAGISAGVSASNNAKNIDAQKQANEQNLAYQKEVNAQNQYNMEHAHQIEMADLQAAGLNPVLTASGGSGASLTKLDAPSVNPIKSDVSGIVNAISGLGSTMSNMMMFSLMSDMRKDISDSHNQTLLAMSGNRDKVLSDLYRRKAEIYNSTNSASTISKATKAAKNYKFNDKHWKSLIDEIANL